jgi:hypothetical protein
LWFARFSHQQTDVLQTMSKLIPDGVVARERYHVHPHTLRRWDKNPALKFPPPIYMNGRRYRDVEKLDAWDRKNSREAATRRAGLTPPAPEAA